MARNKKVRLDRVIILILVMILVLGALGFGVYKLFGLFFVDDIKKQTNQPQVIETTDNIKVTLKDYTIYEDDTNDLGFNFIIANLQFEAEKPISFELKNLQTSEKITLNDVSKYLNKIELAGYSLSKMEINTTGIKTDENKTEAKVFIPYNTDASSLSVYNAVDASKIEFDLTKQKVAATTLKLEDQNTEIEVGSTKVSVTNAYISSFMLHNNDKYETGSSQKVYSFEIIVSDSRENAKISDAIFIEDGTSDEIHCLSGEYKAIDMDNIVGQDLTSGTKGGLFFVVVTNDSEVHDGTLLIKFSNEDKWIEAINSND